jgi:hypothetical protein
MAETGSQYYSFMTTHREAILDNKLENPNSKSPPKRVIKEYIFHTED